MQRPSAWRARLAALMWTLWWGWHTAMLSSTSLMIPPTWRMTRFSSMLVRTPYFLKLSLIVSYFLFHLSRCRSVGHGGESPRGAFPAGLLFVFHGCRPHRNLLQHQLRALPAYARLRRGLHRAKQPLSGQVSVRRGGCGAANDVRHFAAPYGGRRLEALPFRPEAVYWAEIFFHRRSWLYLCA